jgi:hypothetical protein
VKWLKIYLQNLQGNNLLNFRGREALYIANEMINKFDIEDRDTWKESSILAKKFFSSKNGDSQHVINKNNKTGNYLYWPLSHRFTNFNNYI